MRGSALVKERLAAFVDAAVMLAFVLLGLAVAPEMASVGILVSSLVYVLPLGDRHAAREER
jgi:hypothetical protein